MHGRMMMMMMITMGEGKGEAVIMDRPDYLVKDLHPIHEKQVLLRRANHRINGQLNTCKKLMT